MVLEFVVQAPNTNNQIFVDLETATEVDVNLLVEGDEIASSGFFHSLEIDFPQLNYRAIPIGADGDLITYSIQAVIFYDQGIGNPFTLVVQNEFATYLASS